MCVVSDHGFAAIQHDVNLYTAFATSGLFTLDAAQQITSWKAMPWPAGGSAAVMLNDHNNAAVRATVAALLARLAADPQSGVERILSREELVRERGFPDAAFLVSLKIGYEVGLAYSGPLVTAPSNLGMHGFTPDHREMRSSFFVVGPEIAASRSLGEIDMRQIAPTLAKRLGVALPDAELGPLALN